MNNRIKRTFFEPKHLFTQKGVKTYHLMRKPLWRPFLFLIALFSAALLLSGCTSIPFFQEIIKQPTPIFIASPTAMQSQTPTIPLATATPALKTDPLTLTVWFPPQFDPDNGTPAGTLMKAQLSEFARQNPGVRIQVRVKALTGSGSLLETLTTASAAAPSAIPSLILLPRSDLEIAALKGLIYPLDGLTDIAQEPDWFPYAAQLGTVQDNLMGLPLAGDSLVIVYRPTKVGAPVQTWQEILGRGQPIVFPAADPQALFTFALYRSLGGVLQDNQGRPMLESDVLSQVLNFYADGGRQGAFPTWLAQYQTDGQAWQAYNEQRSNWLITWSSRYLSELPADSIAMPIPQLGDTQVTMATGWLFALSDPLPERRELSIRLAESLVNGQFLSEWTVKTSYLPTRPSSLSVWSDQSARNLVNQVVLTSEVKPGNDLSTTIGPILEDATLQIIKNLNEPAQVAESAAERLNSP